MMNPGTGWGCAGLTSPFPNPVALNHHPILSVDTTGGSYDGTSAGLAKRPIVSHLVISVSGALLESCVDSGATYSLLSRSAFDSIGHLPGVGDLQPTKVALKGAAGKPIPLLGLCELTFTIDKQGVQPTEMTYQHQFLVGDLQGVDVLLGIDWLVAVNAVIDFGAMMATIGPMQAVKLTTVPGVRSSAGQYAVQFEGTSADTVGVVSGSYVKLRKKSTLQPHSSTRVFGSVVGGWQGADILIRTDHSCL